MIQGVTKRLGVLVDIGAFNKKDKYINKFS